MSVDEEWKKLLLLIDDDDALRKTVISSSVVHTMQLQTGLTLAECLPLSYSYSLICHAEPLIMTLF